MTQRFSKFEDVALKAFPSLDQNHDGMLEKKEIASAVANQSTKGSAAEVAAVLYRESEDITKLTGSKVINLETLNKLGSPEVASQIKYCANTPTDFQLTWMNPILWTLKEAQRMNHDASGILSNDDLSKAGESGKFFLDHFSEIQNLDKGPAREKGLEVQAVLQFMQNVDDRCDPIYNMNGMFKRTQVLKQSDLSRELFGIGGKPDNSLNIEAVRQGTIGDCQFEAALGSLALKDPDVLAKMVKDNFDGTATVTFPGAPDTPITVSKPTDAELMLFNGPGKYGTWASVIEKAFAQYEKNKSGDESPVLEYQSINKGSTPEEAIQLLTGRESHRIECAPTPENADTLRSELIEAQNNKTILVGGIDIFQALFSQRYDVPAGHAYSIMNFDAEGQDGGTITLRNPWGQEAGPRGVFKMSLKEFETVFSRVYTS